MNRLQKAAVVVALLFFCAVFLGPPIGIAAAVWHGEWAPAMIGLLIGFLSLVAAVLILSLLGRVELDD